MPGILALLLVIIVVFLIFFSESMQKKKMAEQLHTVTGNQKVLYGSMANLACRTGSVRGYFALTEQYICFIEGRRDGTIQVLLQLRYEEVQNHKLHFVMFIEGPDHCIYEIKAAGIATAYNILTSRLKKNEA